MALSGDPMVDKALLDAGSAVGREVFMKAGSLVAKLRSGFKGNTERQTHLG